jgi:uncharacterized protein (TIGR03435 family)
VRVPGAKEPPNVQDSSPATARVGEYSGRRSMGQFAQYLAGIVGRPVLDRTALTGNRDIRLSFAPDLRDTEKPTIFTALQEQLGLRLETSRGQVETIVIENANPPSEN